MKSDSNVLIKFAKACVNACRHSRMPLFSNKYSKKLYKQYQHMCVYMLMKKERKHYRSVIQLLELAPELVRIIGLKRLPHYTTVQKFFRRLSTVLFERILAQTARLFELSGIVAIDSTGFSTNHASRYFMMMKYRRKKGVWKETYIKNSIAADVENQVILASKPRKDKGHDTLDFVPLVRRASSVAGILTVIADKGYDSEANHEFVRNVVKADSVIPVRRGWKNGTVSGKFRREMVKKHHKKTYKKRQGIETVIFVMKAVFGDTVYSRSTRQQKKELKAVCVAYNLYRYAVSCFYLIIRERFSTAVFKPYVSLQSWQSHLPSMFLNSSEYSPHFSHSPEIIWSGLATASTFAFNFSESISISSGEIRSISFVDIIPLSSPSSTTGNLLMPVFIIFLATFSMLSFGETVSNGLFLSPQYLPALILLGSFSFAINVTMSFVVIIPIGLP